MKFLSIMNEKCATMTQAQIDIIDTALSLVPSSILAETNNFGLTISVGTPIQIFEWFNYQFSSTVVGATQGNNIYINQDKFNYSGVSFSPVDIVLHEYMHGYSGKCIEFGEIEKSSEGKRFTDIYNTEKDNITFDEADSHYKRNTIEFYASSFSYYLYYRNNQVKLNQLFGRTPKLRAFIKEIVLATSPTILQDIEDEKRKGVLKVEVGTKIGGGDNALKVSYKNGRYIEYDLGGIGSGGDGIIIQDNTINFDTPHSGIPIGKIVYSSVTTTTQNIQCWLLVSYRIGNNTDCITQDRILLQTNTNNSPTAGIQITERRFFDYNNTRRWSDWKRVNKEKLVSVTLSNSKYTLTDRELQKINNNGNSSAVVSLPTVSDYTSIKLIVSCNTTGTISFEHTRPIRWNATALANITSGKAYEVDLQYIDYATGWICKYNTY